MQSVKCSVDAIVVFGLEHVEGGVLVFSGPHIGTAHNVEQKLAVDQAVVLVFESLKSAVLTRHGCVDLQLLLLKGHGLTLH